MDNVAMFFLKKYDLHKLFIKLGGVGGSFVASHLVALTATPNYTQFWARFYLSAPTITDVPAFEKMVGTYFALAWLMLEHFYWRVETSPTDHVRSTDTTTTTTQGETK